MKKLVAALVASVLAAFALVAPVSPAAAVDGTYPPTQCDIQVSSSTVRSGEAFTVTVTSDVDTDITATYRGVTRSASNTMKLVAEFVAPTTSRDLQTEVTTTCGGLPGNTAGVTVIGDGSGADGDSDADGGADGDVDADGSSQGDADGVNADGANAAADSDADAGDANGILPGTGGTDFWLLLLGVLLLLAGVGAVLHRRRNA